MLIYQRRHDRRPIVLVTLDPLIGGELSGRVYGKWASILFAGRGEHALTLSAGTVRFVNVTGVTLRPLNPLPPPTEVFLVE